MSGADAVALRVRGLSKAYPPPVRSLRVLIGKMLGERSTPTTVLEDVSFDVPVGTTVGIVGANGAGKTTLLKVVGGILPPTQGTVERRGRVGSIFRIDVGVLPDLTGRENALSVARVRGIDEQRALELIPWIADFSELGPFFDRPLRTYSAGMRARLAFAAITAESPEVLIVDEALAVGDVRFAQKCQRRFMELRATGRTVLLVSHDLAQVHAACERVIWMERGRIVHDGPPSAVIGRYRAHVDAQARAHAMQMASELQSSDDALLHVTVRESEQGADVSVLLDSARAVIRIEGPALEPGRRVEVLLESAAGVPALQTSTVAKAARADLVLEPVVLARGRYRATATVEAGGRTVVARREFVVEWGHDEVRTPKLSRSPTRWTQRALPAAEAAP